LHLWHKRRIVDQGGIGHRMYELRVWKGQTRPRANDALTARYARATGDIPKMRALVEQARSRFGRR
jgi:hypothetical protein